MDNKTDSAPNYNRHQDVYYELSNSIGKESQHAADYLSGLQEVVNNATEDRLDADEFWRLQDGVYSEQAAGMITMDEFRVKLHALNDRRARTTQFDQAKRIIDEYGSTARVEFAIEDSGEIDKINSSLRLMGSIDADLQQGAPFENYTSNTDEVWEYVDDKVIHNYLLNKTFLEDYTLDRLEINNAACMVAMHNQTGERDKFFEVPTRLVVSAAGFGSWLGRDDRFGNRGKGEKAIGLPEFAGAAARTHGQRGRPHGHPGLPSRRVLGRLGPRTCRPGSGLHLVPVDAGCRLLRRQGDCSGSGRHRLGRFR